MRWLIKTNAIVFFLVFVVSILPLEATILGRVFRSLVELSAIFFLPGLNIIASLQYFLKRSFTPLETISLASATSLFVIPLILVFEFSKFETIFPLLPLINAATIFIAVIGIFFFVSFVQNKPDAFPKFQLDFQSLKKYFASKTFFLPFFLYSFIAGSIAMAFYPLPDLDPYYWYEKYQALFQSGAIAAITEHRPLFSALSYIFTFSAHTDFYAFFKYVLPFFFLILLFPLSLLTTAFKHPLHKAIIFLFPFVSGITIIYLTLPIPQAIANIAALFAVSLMLYSQTRKDSIFFFAAGAIFFCSYFYHEAMAVPFIMWIIATAIGFRGGIITFIRNNKLTTILLLIILFPFLEGPFQFIAVRVQTYLPAIQALETNFLFPERYINVDGNEMGWGNLIGVAKYYLFYAGPVIGLAFLGLFFSRKHFPILSVFRSKYTLPITLTFIFFFIIAEILPRIANISFLPDRAWVFGGTFALLAVFLIFGTPIGHRKIFLLAILFAFTANIGAALSINNLKKYLITDHQIISAEWIRTNLPSDRSIFSSENHRLLQFYAKSDIIPIQDPNFYFSLETFEAEFDQGQQSKEHALHQYQEQSDQLKKTLSDIRKLDPEHDLKNIQQLFSTTESSISAASGALEEIHGKNSTDTPKHLYIYYASPDPRNPYLDRPYIKKTVENEDEIIFDKYPERFKRIYTDEAHHIYLWEIL